MSQSGWYHDKAVQCDRMALASTSAIMRDRHIRDRDNWREIAANIDAADEAVKRGKTKNRLEDKGPHEDQNHNRPRAKEDQLAGFKARVPSYRHGAPATPRTVHPFGLLGNPFAKIFVGWREQSNVEHNQ